MDCLILPCIFLYSMFSNIQMWLLFWDCILILPLLHSQSMMLRGIFCSLSCTLYHTVLFSRLISLHSSGSIFSLLTSHFFILPFYTYHYMHFKLLCHTALLPSYHFHSCPSCSQMMTLKCSMVGLPPSLQVVRRQR